MMRPELVVFLDDGGVMNNNELRGRQWQRLVGEYFVPRLGGTLEAWAEANHVVASALFDLVAWEARLQAPGDYSRFDRSYQIDWLGGMCDRVGLMRLADDEAVSLAHAASQFVCRRVRSAFPGAVEAVRTLHAKGYRLHTASGESSRELTSYLEGMGVRNCFQRLYGPDLIATFKSGPAYYERLLADAGVSPEYALIVDDSPKATAWAGAIGAQTVLVGPVPGAQVSAVIESLAELPNLLAGRARLA